VKVTVSVTVNVWFAPELFTGVNEKFAALPVEGVAVELTGGVTTQLYEETVALAGVGEEVKLSVVPLHCAPNGANLEAFADNGVITILPFWPLLPVLEVVDIPLPPPPP
jgi:hypothetical protein